DPSDRSRAPLFEMPDYFLLFGIGQPAPELIVDFRQLAPQTEVRFVVIIDVSRAGHRSFRPIRFEMPLAGAEQELLRFPEIPFITGDVPDHRRRFGYAGNQTA